MNLPYEIADMCKDCIKRHIKAKGEFKIKCVPVPKSMETEKDSFYPLDKMLGKNVYSQLSEEAKIDLQLEYNVLLWAKECLGWSPYNTKRNNFYQYYQREYLLCTAKNKVMRFGRRLGKCVSENSIITTYNRGPILAKNLKKTDVLLTFDEKTKKITPTKNWVKTDNGVKDCLEILTETGKIDSVTLNHPYYVLRDNKYEWVEAKDLKVGDKVYRPKIYKNIFKEFEKQKSEPEKYRLLGCFLSKTGKHIPAKIYKSSLTNLSFLISGIFNYNTLRKGNEIIYSNISSSLMIGLKHLLVRFGIHANFEKLNDCYRLTINTKEKYEEYEEIKRIRYIGERQTYSISVQGTHTFITNDIVTHNTEGMVVDILHYALLNPGKKILVIGPFLSLITEIFDRIETLLLSNDSVYKSDYSRKKQPVEYIKLSNGSTIKGFTTGADGNSIRGQSADKVYLDEAAYIPQEAFKAIMAFKMDNNDVSFNAASTPSMLESNFKEWCLSNTSWREFYYPSTILPNFEKEDGPELRASLTEDAYQLEVEAKFIEGSKRVFKSHNVKNSMFEYRYIDSRQELENPYDWYITIG